eukprot:CAMPEP_0194322032 /NCGR_PEP_ID=MMETSP0171-20130528/18235_1 /TAXON_ID=218684 /ORGANISM="Corethron pennatum, Strain L29A3" /LENGTH=242 /DNA_ID=CAMNT_0039080175 /DNA_START=108 /DNA_END=834 /DNA_ORIENTATION=+
MSPNANENIVCQKNSSSGKKRCIDTNERECPTNNLNSSLKSHNSLKRRRIVSSDELSTFTTKLTGSLKIQAKYGLTVKNYACNATKPIDHALPCPQANAIGDDNDILPETDNIDSEKKMPYYTAISDDEDDSEISYLADNSENDEIISRSNIPLNSSLIISSGIDYSNVILVTRIENDIPEVKGRVSPAGLILSSQLNLPIRLEEDEKAVPNKDIKTSTQYEDLLSELEQYSLLTVLLTEIP